MGLESPKIRANRECDQERRTIVIRTTDAVIRELLRDGRVEEFTPETQHILLRILRQNLRGRTGVLAGENETLAGVEVRAVEVGFLRAR